MTIRLLHTLPRFNATRVAVLACALLLLVGVGAVRKLPGGGGGDWAHWVVHDIQGLDSGNRCLTTRSAISDDRNSCSTTNYTYTAIPSRQYTSVTKYCWSSNWTSNWDSGDNVDLQIGYIGPNLSTFVILGTFNIAEGFVAGVSTCADVNYTIPSTATYIQVRTEGATATDSGTNATYSGHVSVLLE